MAGKIPQQFIDEVLQRIDIVDVIDRRVPLKKAGKDFQACCPFHDEKTPSFTVSQSKQFYHCFGCGANGNVISFLMNYEHMEFPEAIEDLAGDLGIEVPREASSGPNRPKQHESLLPLLDRANRYFKSRLRQHANAPVAVNYLKKRGLSGEVARHFELGFAPDEWDGLIKAFSAGEKEQALLEKAGLVIRREKSGYYDRFRGRIMFPIRDHRGRVVGFGGRIIDSGEPKYLNSPETPVFHKGSELYGLYTARNAIRDLAYVIVVEGYMDVVALAQHGVDNAVATLGTATTPQHLHRLFRAAPHVVFCFDGDRAGRDAARKAMDVALPEMHSGRQVSFLFLPEGADPDDFIRENGRQAFIEAVQAAMPLDDFLFRHLDENTDLRRRDGRARLIELARPMVSRIPPGPYKELMTQKLTELSGLDNGGVVERLMRSNDSQAPAAAAKKPGAARHSPFAWLISLLLQHPELIHKMPEMNGMAQLPHPAIPTLLKLIELLRTGEKFTTASLVERFRGSSFHQRLENLAGWDHQVPEGRLEETFAHYANRAQLFTLEANIDELLEKAADGGLDDEEKTRLSQFIRLKQSLRLDMVESEDS